MATKENNREKALIALLNTTSVKTAAVESGISERTLFRYLEDADFRSEYRQARRQIVSDAIALLQSNASEAVKKLKELMDFCENPAVSARCAQLIFENSIKAMETEDLAERLENLEYELTKQVAATRKPNNRHY
jgi:hypothetical protein